MVDSLAELLDMALAKRMAWQGPSQDEKYIAECINYDENDAPNGWVLAYENMQIPRIIWREGFKFTSKKAKKLYIEWLKEQLSAAERSDTI